MRDQGCCRDGTSPGQVQLDKQHLLPTWGLLLKCNIHVHICRLVCHNHVSRVGSSNYMPQYLWGVNTCPRPSTYEDLSWWRHQLETFSALLALCAGNSPVPVNSLHKGQWRGALMFSFIYARINDWVNNREAGDLRRQDGHHDVIVMCARSRHQGRGQIITAQRFCGRNVLVPVLDTCF